MLPQSNARLTSVKSDGPSEDWDVVEGAGASKWIGDSDAYAVERISTHFSEHEGGLVRARDIHLIIPNNLQDSSGTPLVIRNGDVVTFMFDGVLNTRRVMEYSAPSLPGLARYIRLHLDPQPVERASEEG